MSEASRAPVSLEQVAQGSGNSQGGEGRLSSRGRSGADLEGYLGPVPLPHREPSHGAE